MQSKEMAELFARCQEKLRQISEELRTQSHVLAEHATIIHARSELALDEVFEGDRRLRGHLHAIHGSAEMIVDSSKALRKLITE
jgi:hypothetical protein